MHFFFILMKTTLILGFFFYFKDFNLPVKCRNDIQINNNEKVKLSVSELSEYQINVYLKVSKRGNCCNEIL